MATANVTPVRRLREGILLELETWWAVMGLLDKAQRYAPVSVQDEYRAMLAAMDSLQSR